jgi:hypothetical protein
MLVLPMPRWLALARSRKAWADTCWSKPLNTLGYHGLREFVNNVSLFCLYSTKELFFDIVNLESPQSLDIHWPAFTPFLLPLFAGGCRSPPWRATMSMTSSRSLL